jgi:hypothetical protein
MKRALVTFAVATHEPLLEYALPAMERYADWHGYDLITTPPRMLLRPPSWHKITAVLTALDTHDEVLWVDADVLILDDTVDLADEVDDQAWQAITRHHTREGEVPSVGVWYVRQPMRPWLERAWTLTKYLHHRWWEQAAMLQLLGYRADPPPCRLSQPTELYANTFWLGEEWNQLHLQYPADTVGEPVTTSPRFVHVGPGSPIDWRLTAMRELTSREKAPAIQAKGA